MYDVRAGVLSKSMKSNVIISIPTIRVQLSVSPNVSDVTCKFGEATYQIVQSLGGYLLSIDVGDANWRGPWNKISKRSIKYNTSLDKTTCRFKKFISDKKSTRSKRSAEVWEFSENLKTSTEYAQLRYEQTFVIRQINKNFGLFQKTICDTQYQKWINLNAPDLARKVANYITGKIYNIGESHYGIFQIQHTARVISKVALVYPMEIKYGMYKASRIQQN